MSNEPKTYGLSNEETSLLIFVRNHMDAIFSGIISTISATRLGHTVTPNTQFNLSGDMKSITIMELPTPEEVAAQPAVAESPVVTAPETAPVEPEQPAPVAEDVTPGELVEPNAPEAAQADAPADVQEPVAEAPSTENAPVETPAPVDPTPAQ